MTILRNSLYIILQLIRRLLQLVAPVRITAVELESVAAGRTYQLDPYQVSEFEDEFRRVTFFPPGKGLYQAVAPDCLIRVRTSRGNFEYEIYGQTVLYDPAHDDSWQFYFGLVLLDWLNP